MSDPYPETPLGRIAKAIHDELYPEEEHRMDECERAALASVRALAAEFEPTSADEYTPGAVSSLLSTEVIAKHGMMHLYNNLKK